MEWKIHIPAHPILRKYIETIPFISRKLEVGKKATRICVLPRSGPSLYLDFSGCFKKDGPWLRRAVHGFHERGFDLTVNSDIRLDWMIVNFTETGLSRFARVHMEKITGCLVDADVIFGGELRDIFNRMIRMDSYEERIWLLEEYLLSRFRSPDPVDLYLEEKNMMVSQKAGLPSFLADFSDLSSRQLERRYRRLAGVSRRDVSRIRRFEHFQTMAHSGVVFRLTDMAQELGYYDQSQFIREVKRITGMTPGEFLRHPAPCRIPRG